MTQYKFLTKELWSGERSICFFVHSGKSYWVVDQKFNFTLDAEKDYRAYRDKGHITTAQYELACSSFRDGILKMTADNFLDYVMAAGRKVLSSQALKEVFKVGLGLDAHLHEAVEKYYLVGGDLDEKDVSFVRSAASRLPMFYINFDRDIFMHMDHGRAHEDLAYANWTAKCADFCYLIPDRERYWVSGSADFWKYRFL